MEINKIYQMDCLVGLRQMDEGSVDLTVTSPPYDDLRTYNGYAFDFENVARELLRVTKPGGVVVWIVADSTIKGSESGTSFKQALFFKEIGFNLHDTMIWNKGTNPFQHRNRYINAFEYMFIFSKGKPSKTNIIRDRKNKYAGTRVHGTERQRDGSTRKLSEIQKSKVVRDFGSRLNVWEMTSEKKNKTAHPAPFPENLAADHILSWSNPGDVVLDPFIGSGTTARAAITNRRHFIGFEISEEYAEIAKFRTNDIQQTLNLSGEWS